jgi:hypothetical protein
MWQERQAQLAGSASGGGAMGIGGAVSRISVQDVGEVDFDTSGGFSESAARARAGTDPLLGPWITLLDSYMDARVQMGSPLIPVTRPVVP